jgi:Tol biopolymer transport system component
MTLQLGARLGSYEIIVALGAGGMGEVYRAKDTKLGRDVALKVLPASFTNDPERVARFRREAQVLASLNHPHIAQIHGLEEVDGTQFLVLELVDGESLDKRIARGRIPVDEALGIARQIAEALEAAHEKGIIHRDLKPANIALTNDGNVKVLDFGLAKAVEATSWSASDATNSPTITSAAMMTGVGVILGTAAYMSPEQAKGRAADKRSDIWAFGCVLYEMLTGKRAFGGTNVPEMLADVIKGNPDWSVLPRSTPAAVCRLLRRCLANDPRARIGDASTARLEIDEASSPGVTLGNSAMIKVPAFRWRPSSIQWTVAAVGLLAALFVGLLPYVRRAAEDRPAFRAVIPLPENTLIGGTGYPAATLGLSIALSPNGRYVVFVATSADGIWRLWLRSMDGGAAQLLAGTENGTRPFWSPDSRSVGFFADHKLKRIDTAVGRVLTVWDAPGEISGGGAWNADGVILFATSLVGVGPPGRIYRVPVSGGTPAPVTSTDADAAESGDSAPIFLPDGRHFLYTHWSSTTRPSVFIGSIDGSDKALLLDRVTNVQYAQDRLLFLRGTTLVSQPFSTRRLALSGDVVPVVEGVAIDPRSRTGLFSASATGVLAYHSATEGVFSQLTWFDRAGKVIGLLGGPANYNTVNLSPDGTRAAVSLRDPSGNQDIWLIDVNRNIPTRFTFDPTDEAMGIWSPDGTRIVFDSLRNGRRDLYQKPADGSGNEERIEASPISKYATSWSPDGRFLLYHSTSATPQTGNDIWVLPIAGDRKPFPFLQTRFDERRAQFSPDGQWVAYQSNESGQHEVYVARFPGAGGKRRVSPRGGGSPRWRRDGKELFYVDQDGNLMAAVIDSRGSVLEVGDVRPLFRTKMRDQNNGTPYDVTADGQRFLLNALVQSTTTPTSIELVVNWPALLRR